MYMNHPYFHQQLINIWTCGQVQCYNLPFRNKKSYQPLFLSRAKGGCFNNAVEHICCHLIQMCFFYLDSTLSYFSQHDTPLISHYWNCSGKFLEKMKMKNSQLFFALLLFVKSDNSLHHCDQRMMMKISELHIVGLADRSKIWSYLMSKPWCSRF